MSKPRDTKDDWTRRQALLGLGGVAASAVLPGLGCGPGKAPVESVKREPTPAADELVAAKAPRMPVIYVPHGGGPWPFVEVGFGPKGTWDGLRAYLAGLPAALPEPPKALLVVSAHWEAPKPTVSTAAKPTMLYDYSGFPKAAYSVQWPAPGSPKLAAQVRQLLQAAGIESTEDAERGFDHGTFVVTKVAWPEAKVPTIQLSLQRGLDPTSHLALGRTLQPLRDQGVLILGSGMSYHNMRGFRTAARGGENPATLASRVFDAWLVETIAAAPAERERRLTVWETAPAARACHPREEHLLPLMVRAGAAGDSRGTVPYRDLMIGAHVSAAHFG